MSNGSGWNDPPPLMTKAGAATEPTLAPSSSSGAPPGSDPITQPLFGAPEPAPAPTPAPGWAGFTPAPVPGPGGYHQDPAPPANQPPAPAPAAPAAPAAPIPAEHQVIQDTLENLRSKCQQGINNENNSHRIYTHFSSYYRLRYIER